MLLRSRVTPRDAMPALQGALPLAFPSELLIVAGIALATIALHFVADGRYGYQRDELYYLVCGRRLAWGYVDQPPLIAFIARATELTLGNSLYALRFLPSLAAAGLALCGAGIVRMLGGGRFAQAAAMMAIALAPFDLAVGSLMTMNAFEPLFWTGAAVLTMVALRSDRPPSWVWPALGLTVGMGLLNKYSMGAWAISLAAGVAISRSRALFVRPGFLVLAALATALVLPTLFWQYAHQWPQIALLQNAHAQKNAVVSPVQYVLAQVLMMNPLAAPLWIAGLVWFLAGRGAERYRAIGYAYLVLLVLYLAVGAKVYYLAPVYAIFMAAGAVVIERFLHSRRAWRPVYLGALIAVGLVIAPQATPLLPLDAFLAYQRAFDLRSVKMERHATGAVPQNFADMFGWEKLVSTLAADADALTPAERKHAAIITGNYGQAAALEVLGSARRLPPVLSGHTNYWIWGTHGVRADVALAVGVPLATLHTAYRRVERVDMYRDRWVLPDQNELAVYKCSDPVVPLPAAWPAFRAYI